MKNMKWLCAILLLVAISISGLAQAAPRHGGGHGGHVYSGHRHSGHGHVGIGLYFGVPYGYPYYPPYYYPYYYPPVMVTPAQPPVYIEQAPPSSYVPPDIAAPTESDHYYWYHCDKPDGYYPYIKECPSGWQKVTPTPPANP
jgi:hypothetical protein